MEFPNAATAAKYLKVSYNTVYGVLQANRLSVKGYQIKRKNDCKIIKKYKNRQGGKFLTSFFLISYAKFHSELMLNNLMAVFTVKDLFFNIPASFIFVIGYIILWIIKRKQFS